MVDRTDAGRDATWTPGPRRLPSDVATRPMELEMSDTPEMSDRLIQLAEMLRDLNIRVDTLHTALGAAISFMDGKQRELIIAVLARGGQMTPEQDPRGVSAKVRQDLIGYLSMSRMTGQDIR